MIPRLLLAVSVAILSLSGTMVTAGLEQLESRYGQAYPGYAGLGGVGLSATPYGLGQQSAFGMGVGVQQPILQQQPIMQQLMQQQQEQFVQPQLDVGFSSQYGTGSQTEPLGLGQITEQPWMAQSQVNVQAMLSQQQQPVMQGGQGWMQGGEDMELGLGQNQQLGLNLGLGQQQFGGVGSFGANPGLGASKKTTTAAPIYAQSMIVPKIITQPILRPHSVTQPIVQQQLIQQPIVETRQVIQPVIRRIITQPIIRPEIYESTTIQPTLKTETTVQPHIVQQSVVTPMLQNQYEENAAITEKARMQVQAPVVQPTISAKKSGGGLGFGGLGYGQ